MCSLPTSVTASECAPGRNETTTIVAGPAKRDRASRCPCSLLFLAGRPRMRGRPVQQFDVELVVAVGHDLGAETASRRRRTGLGVQFAQPPQRLGEARFVVGEEAG